MALLWVEFFCLHNDYEIFVETLSSWKEIELKPMKLKELLDKN